MTETLTAEAPALDLRLLRDEDERAAALRSRMHSPLCGVLTSMGFLSRTRTGPRMLIASGDLTGVHVLQGRPAPKPGSFHLGGSGTVPFESHIRVLAESLERYAGHAVVAEDRFPVRRATWAELTEAGEPTLPLEAFALFTPDQYARDGFPYQRFTPDAPLSWVRLRSLLGVDDCWVPAQWFLLGHLPDADELWLQSAVTTGTAAHTDPGRALAAALEEVVQLDSAMGHWHGATRSIRIELDHRTRHLTRILEQRFPDTPVDPEFHLLPNADLPGFSVACLLRQPEGLLPRIAIGLGSGARLVPAMYRALLEAAGVQWLASWVAIEERAEGGGTQGADADGFYDLEANVGHYAGAEGSRLVERRFADCDRAAAADLPPDAGGTPKEIVRSLVTAFRDTGKRLYWADLSTVDIAGLGFSVQRVWSPDTLSLPLPSAPPAAHRRFEQYGGFRRYDPHPYP
ncbi:YcaO-like family protein [Streptomyces puniciscabiei]|uniref:YcaO-like family protein n=1 Tax=Streptomyces puniciscabiei TaxID=164348 RepID=UPI0037B04A1A